jgi:predicted ATPase/signal transduction histidine kinase
MSAVAQPTQRLETLRQDEGLVLYRSLSADDQSPLLVLASEGNRPACLQRLEREYGHRDDLDPAWAVRPLALVRTRERPMLLLEDPGGELLSRQVGRPWEVTLFLRVAIGIATAVGRMHERGFIHKDLKPANILVSPTTGAAWLTGFAIASRLPREQQAPESPEVIAGTFAYMAPEQTGRMNRSMDSRSDLYAMGVTLYELLTGVKPFTATDPIEWIHCHIARPPPPPEERTARVPRQLSAIVMKLLAKIPEERYQTSAGVESDLRRCLCEWEATGRIEPFPVGLDDTSDRLLIPEQLYGREAEISTLLAAFERVVIQGDSALVLVTGYSGIGKSSVVNELKKAILQPRGIFISGKFDQQQRDVPYATLAQAFQSLMRCILGGSDEELCRWRDEIRTALGGQASLLTELIPELSAVLGETPPALPELPAGESALRFHAAFQRLVGVFAREEHPLVVFLDDLQWLDPATLTLVEHLIVDRDTRHLLLIGAYRDNEVGPGHPLLATLQTLRQAEVTVEEVSVGPLSVDAVNRLLCDALRSEEAHVRPLAELVHGKTGGNPFFAGQFLANLTEESLLWFDASTRRWVWDLDGIGLQRVTDNLVDLMIARLRRLPADSQGALMRLASLGNHADSATLANLQECSEEAMHASLRAAVQAGAILWRKDGYEFPHDRLQESAYALVPASARAELHLRIGRLLLQGMTRQQVDERVFDVVNQLNRGSSLVSVWGERERVAELNLLAARKARASTAYASACAYLAVGMALLADTGWLRCHELAWSLWHERAECELLNSEFEQAELLVEELLSQARTKVDRANAYRLRMTQQSLRGDNTAAVRTALECLQMLGLELPASPTPAQVLGEYEALRGGLGDRSIEGLADLPLMHDLEKQACMRILASLAFAAYLTDSRLNQMVVFRAVRFTLEHGTSEHSATLYGALSVFLGPVFHRFEDAERFARLAVAIVERHRFSAQRTATSYIMQMAVLWTQPIETALACLEAAIRSARQTGEIIYACAALEHRLTDRMARGDPLDQIWHESEGTLEVVRRAKFRQVIDIVSSIQLFVQSLHGPTQEGVAIDEARHEDEVVQGAIPVVVCFHWILQMQRHFLLDGPQAALAFAAKAEPTLWSARYHIQSVDYCLYHSLAIAAVLPSAAPQRQAALREALATNLASLERWAHSCPATFSHKHAIVAAEAARLEGRDVDALRLYEHAIRSAAASGFVQDQALANESAARFCFASGLESIALNFLRAARDCYRRWGAHAKVERIEHDHPEIKEDTPASSVLPTIEAPAEHLDLATIVKMSQTLSGEIVLEKLIGKLMTVAVEHAGAERGLLILRHGDEMRVEAQAQTASGGVVVDLVGEPATAMQLPDSVVRYVSQTRQRVILGDACVRSAFSDDSYILHARPRSLLCLPLMKQAELVGILYLENRLASHVFTAARCSVLDMLSSAAAVSLENARLYAERTRAEEALRQSEERFALAVAGSNEGIFDWDLVQDRVYLAHRTQELLGLPPGEPWRRSAEWRGMLTMHPDDRAVQRSTLKAYLKGVASAYDVEFRMILPGGIRWFRQRGIALRDASGRAYRMVGSTGDITQHKTEQQEMQRLEERLRQAQRFEAMGSLAGGIAHDFNNILGAILGYGERALRVADTHSRQRSDIANVIAAGERGRALVDRILSYSRGSGADRGVVHVEKVVREALDLLQAKIPATCTLAVSLRAGRAAIIGDSTEVHQIVMNLGTNAVQAMPDGGRVSVSLSVAQIEAAPPVNIGTVTAGEWLVLEVTDTGSGIAPDIVGRIFDPFFTTKDVGAGTGLGLSLVLRIVTQAGGAIAVVSEVGSGSTFKVYLPRAGDATDDQEDDELALPRGCGQRVLVVDDEDPLLTLITETLEDLGYAAVGFTSSVEALDAFRADPGGFDALVTDERMPRMTGSALIREVHRIRQSIPVILVTGAVSAAAEQAGHPGACKVLKKPLSAGELAMSMAQVFSSSRR